MSHDPNILPAGLPVPENDGLARHLVGAPVPDLRLAATDGREVSLHATQSVAANAATGGSAEGAGCIIDFSYNCRPWCRHGSEHQE